jgi:uncharacterized protein YbjQ (UPF0145 family)
MEDLIIFAVLFGSSYLIGRYKEKKHFAEIVRREKELLALPALTLKHAGEEPVVKTKLVTGNVVIAGDYFKQIMAFLASLFGMRISVAESMMDRARREAVLRMKEEAFDADVILNVRIQSMQIGDRKSVNGVEVMACGTAVYYAQ